MAFAGEAGELRLKSGGMLRLAGRASIFPDSAKRGSAQAHRRAMDSRMSDDEDEAQGGVFVSGDESDPMAARRLSETLVPAKARPLYRWVRGFRSPLKPIVRSNWFEFASVFLMVYCSVVYGVQADLEQKEDDSTFFVVNNWVMFALLLLEWVLRVVVGGVFWFKDWVNVAFTISVWFPVLGILLSGFGNDWGSVQVATRWFRLSRAIHIVKNVECLRVVWLLVSGLFSSGLTLFWSCTLLVLTVSFFGVLSVEVVGRSSLQPSVDAEIDPGSKVKMFRHAGSAILVMMRFTNNDDAMDILEQVMKFQPWACVFFFAFIAITQYVLLNLITAVICNNALKVVLEDEERYAEEAQRERDRQLQELKNLFYELDSNDSGEIDSREFDDAFEIPALQHKLLLLGIEEAELKRLFRALDCDGSGCMDVEEFAEGLSELQGEASAYGMLKAKKKAERTEKLARRWLESLEGKSTRPRPGEISNWADTHLDLQVEILELEEEVDARLEAIDEEVANLTDKAVRMAACLKVQ